MGVQHKKFKEDLSAKVESINPNPQQDYENKKAGALMKGWNVKVSGIDIDEEIVYHSKGKDSEPRIKVGETITFDLIDVVHDQKGHWYYKMSVKSDFNKSKYVNPDVNKKRMKSRSMALADFTIQYFIESKLVNPQELSPASIHEYAGKIFKFITGYNDKDKVHKHENDLSTMELRAACYESVLANNVLYSLRTMKDIGVAAVNLIAEMEAK